MFSKAETASAVQLDDDVILKEMNTRHSNYINGAKIFEGTVAAPKKLCTSDINGYFNYWDV
jgi:hypothetical protein